MDAPSTGPTRPGAAPAPHQPPGHLLMVVLFLGCWLGWIVHRARVQRAAVDSVERVGGVVLYEWQYKDGKYIPGGRSWWPRWLVSVLGVDYLGSVVRVIVTQEGPDAVLDQISGLGRLEELIFTSSSPSDAGLAQPGRTDRVEVSGSLEEWGHRRRSLPSGRAHGPSLADRQELPPSVTPA